MMIAELLCEGEILELKQCVTFWDFFVPFDDTLKD